MTIAFSITDALRDWLLPKVVSGELRLPAAPNSWRPAHE